MLKGTIFITNDINVVYNFPVGRLSKIVSMDEDNTLGENKDIIGGLNLLPPMEAKIAESDGNEQMYDVIYQNHLLQPSQQQFIAALIAFMYKGGSLLLFLPEIGYTNTMEKFIQHMFICYGIHVGMIGNPNPQIANCFYDMKCIPIWLNLIYTSGVIGAEEFLFMYPRDCKINNPAVIDLLIQQLNPYGQTINDKIKAISRYHQLVHKNPKVQQVLQSIN